eukprot:CAMPEP_0197022894 /NCGR_PEP_ID=MMETSP1384-20130603/3699_1 /TAXON_ID=29189 /ORGANISM="Ammonia sp." /LENGTH=159 /DNA_ID=CAMNT_0042451015 /DNA_START=175 /DNA_END=654 /DNA_ORIENTATION=+
MNKPTNVQERISTNLSYYAGNYLAIFAILFAFTCLLNIFLLFGVLFVIGCGFGVKMYLKQQLEIAEVKGGKTKRKQQQKLNKQIAVYYCYAALFILFLFGNAPLASCIFVTLVIVLAHAALRKRNIKSNMVHFMDVYKDFGPISTFAEWICDQIDENTK